MFQVSTYTNMSAEWVGDTLGPYIHTDGAKLAPPTQMLQIMFTLSW